VVVAEVGRALNEDGRDDVDADPQAPFGLGGEDRALGRLDERTLAGADEQ
jgi:hypothetical protein